MVCKEQSEEDGSGVSAWLKTVAHAKYGGRIKKDEQFAGEYSDNSDTGDDGSGSLCLYLQGKEKRQALHRMSDVRKLHKENRQLRSQIIQTPSCIYTGRGFIRKEEK
jgi:hypothetical protein